MHSKKKRQKYINSTVEDKTTETEQNTLLTSGLKVDSQSEESDRLRSKNKTRREKNKSVTKRLPEHPDSVMSSKDHCSVSNQNCLSLLITNLPKHINYSMLKDAIPSAARLHLFRKSGKRLAFANFYTMDDYSNAISRLEGLEFDGIKIHSKSVLRSQLVLCIRLPVHEDWPSGRQIRGGCISSDPRFGEVRSKTDKAYLAKDWVTMMSRALNLPKKEIIGFDGNPMNYWSFIRNFEDCFDESIGFRSRLNYLIQYCDGEAKNTIVHCALLEPEEGYRKALELLEEAFGQKHIVAHTFIDKMLNIPAIKGTDPYNLRRLSREMHICREPSFKDICEFVKEQSDIADTRYGSLVTGDPSNRNQKQSIANTKGHLDSAYKARVSFANTNELHHPRLGLEGESKTILLKTLDNQSTFQCKGVQVEISPLDSSSSLRIPNVWTVERLPMLRTTVPTASHLASWTHLKDINFPRVEDDNANLLIGCNTQNVHETKEIRTGKSDEPSAVRTLFGSYGEPCKNNHVVNHLSAKEELEDKFEQLYSTEFKDPFSRTISMSVEDRVALSVISSSVQRLNEHYQIALPWRQ
ncbi:unnamed protein product, partial [Schistosoma margrebowiei]